MGGFDVLSAARAAEVLSAAREVQLPLLAAVLIGACAAKTRRAISMHSFAAGISPTAMFPVRLRHPMALALCAGELVLGVALVVTAGPIGTGLPALVTRSVTALLFGTAVAALHELRSRRPETGCGCFGDLSDTPVSWRALARSALLCAAAVATIGERPLHLPASAGQAGLVLSALAVELIVLAMLSPEIGELMVRLGYSEPCEVRRLPVSRTLAALRASAHWRRYRRYLVSTEPVDVWREGCWRFVVFPGMLASRRVEIVFAVYLKPRRAPVRAGIFDATADKRACEAADAIAGVIADTVPAPRPEPVPRPAVPDPVSAQPAHGIPRRVQHHTPRRVLHQRHRHSAGL